MAHRRGRNWTRKEDFDLYMHIVYYGRPLSEGVKWHNRPEHVLLRRITELGWADLWRQRAAKRDRRYYSNGKARAYTR